MVPSGRSVRRCTFGLGGALLLVAVGVTGCGQDGAPADGGQSPSPSEPVDVVEVATEMLREGFDAEIDLRLSLTLLGETVTFRGSGSMVGPDMAAQFTSPALGGKKTPLSLLVVDGTQYQKTGAGPWVETPAKEPGSDFGLSLVGLDAREPLQAGRHVTYQGEPVQVLTRSISGPAAAKALGLSGRAAKITLRQRILVRDDGTPVQLSGEVVSLVAGQRMTLRVELQFGVPTTSEPITAPADPWKQVKVREGLTAAVPDSWSPSSDKDCPECDRFLGDYGAELLLITNPGFCPPEVCIDGLMDMVEERGGQATTHRARMINGVTWQVASMVDRGSEGDRYALTAGVTNLGGLFVVVYSWDGPGQQRSAQTMFDQFAWTLTLGS